MTTYIEKDMCPVPSQDLGGQRHLKNNFETLAHVIWHFWFATTFATHQQRCARKYKIV